MTFGSSALLIVLISTTACARSAERAGADTITPADTDALAEHDCVRDEPRPALAADPPGRFRPRFERTGKLEATEDIGLDDTTSLRITHGGCAHYVETYTFTVRGAVRDTADTRFWLTRAAEYLRALPVVGERQSQIAGMVTGLREAASAPTFTYGEPVRIGEMTLLWATVRRAGRDAVVVEIVFDVSL